jgi:hypothetical protein
LSEIVKRIVAEMIGIALTALRHMDDALGDLFARPLG